MSPVKKELLINSNDFNMMADPVGRQINPSAVAAGLDFFFEHFFTENFKLHLASGGFRRRFSMMWAGIIRHYQNLLIRIQVVMLMVKNLFLRALAVKNQFSLSMISKWLRLHFSCSV